LVVLVHGRNHVDGVLETARGAGARVLEVTPRYETLEDLFVREAIDTGSSDADVLT
jgi:hypothetical protein